MEECSNTIEENNISLVLQNNDCTMYFSLFLVFLSMFLVFGIIIYIYWNKRLNRVPHVKCNPKIMVTDL